jgi:hypothetical protein
MSEKDLETPEIPKKEEVKTETSPEMKSQAPTPEQENLLKLKGDIADLYITNILNKRKS